MPGFGGPGGGHGPGGPGFGGPGFGGPHGGFHGGPHGPGFGPRPMPMGFYRRPHRHSLLGVLLGTAVVGSIINNNRTSNDVYEYCNYCPNCGQERTDSSTFCRSCGKTLVKRR